MAVLFRFAVLTPLLALVGCSSGEGPGDLGTRAVIIGIDGADWKIIDELTAKGRMPNLSRLRARGVSGPIETLNDIALSPVIWTSIATGKTAAKHGVAWFMVDQPDGTRVPVRSYNRKVKALWNILGERGDRPVVVGWWATYPAEDVRKGLIVSDALGFHGFGATARGGDDKKKTYPPALYEELYPLVPPEQQIGADFVGRFIHITPEEYHKEMFDPGRYPQRDPYNPIQLFQEYAVTAQGYSAIAQRLLDERRYDLFMVYFEQVDSFSHLFMKYAPPPLPWVDPTEAARYGDAVKEWYVYQDELLGQLLAKIDLEKTAVFVLSDHGFKTGDRRIRSEATIDVKRAHLDHEPQGIFLAVGPHIRRGVKIEDASVLDVAPTVLHYLGFPVAKDMDGKVLEALFEPEFKGANAIRYVATYEGAAKTEARAGNAAEPTSSSEQAEREASLRALGYLGGGNSRAKTGKPPDQKSSPDAGGRPTEPGAKPGDSSPELHNNLGRIYLRNNEAQKAQREFEQALELDPQNADALLNLAAVHRAAGRVGEAEQLVQRALQVDPNSIAALSELAEVQRRRGNLAEAIRLLQEAVAIDGSLPFVHLGLGDCLQRAGRFKEAEKEFQTVLELEPDSFEALYDLGVTYSHMGRVAEAAANYKKALAKDPNDPEASNALNNLGYLALEQGKTEVAIGWFEKAVKSSPRNLESRYNLAVEYLRKNRVEAAIKLLEEAAQIAPNHELVNERLGLAYLEANRAQDAYRSFVLVRRLYPKNWNAVLGLAALQAASGHAEEARKLLDEAFRLGGSQAHSRAADYAALQPLLKSAPKAGNG